MDKELKILLDTYFENFEFFTEKEKKEFKIEIFEIAQDLGEFIPVNSPIYKEREKLHVHKSPVKRVKGNKQVDVLKKIKTSPEAKETPLKANIEKKVKSTSKSIVFLRGDETFIETPTEELVSFYALVELDDIIQSHDENTFMWNDKYPKQCQERDYRKSAEKDKVLTFSSHFKPQNLVNDSPEAMSGPPIITKEGIVLGGNGRIMILKRVKRLGQFFKYENYLRNKLFNFGLNDVKKFDSFKYPTLVRVINSNMSNCAFYSRILNESLSRAKDHNTNILSLAKSLSNKGFLQISEIFDNEDSGTFNQIISQNKNQKIVIDILRKEGILNASNSPQWISENGELTANGKNNLENLLLAKILPSEELIEGAKEYTNRILKAIPVLTKIQTLSKEYDLIPVLRDVIKFENIRRTQGVSIKEFLNQKNMFGDEEMPNTTIAMLWLSLNSGVNKFREMLESYYTSAKNNENEDKMFAFEKSSPEDILKKLVSNNGLNDKIKLNVNTTDYNYIRKGNEIHAFFGKDCKYYYVAGSKFSNGSTGFLKTAMYEFTKYNKNHKSINSKIYRFKNKTDANNKIKSLLKNSGYFTKKESKNVQLTLANRVNERNNLWEKFKKWMEN